MKNKIVKALLYSICQYIILIAAIMIYDSILKLKHPNIAIGMAYYYYFRIILPITILIFNSTFFIKKKVKVIFYLVPTIIILLYWISSIKAYPFRVSFIIVASLLILFISPLFRRWSIK